MADKLKFGIAVFHGIGDILNCTPVAKQLKKDFPYCHVTWFTSRKLGFILENNKYIDDLVLLDGAPKALDEEIESISKSSDWDKFIAPAPYLHYDKLPGGALLDLIKIGSGMTFTEPFISSFTLLDSEKKEAESYWKTLPEGKKILVETEFYSDQSPWIDGYAFLMLDILKNIDPVFVFTSKNKPPFFDEFKGKYDKSFWCNLPFRLNAELFNLSDAFIGVSSGISCLTFSDYCRTDIPRIEISSGDHWSASNFSHHSELFISYSIDRFLEGLVWMGHKLGDSSAQRTFSIRLASSINNPGTETDSCLICNSESYEPVRGNDIVRCLGCGNVYLRNRMSPEAMENYYKTKYAVNDLNAAHAVRLPQNKEIIDKDPGYIGSQRRDFLEEAARVYGKDIKGGTLVDIGCGWGALLHHARSLGMNTIGFELTEPNVEFGRNVLGLDIRQEQFVDTDIPENSVDIVIMSHSLELMPYPFECVEKIEYILKPGGVFFCVVPNFGSFCSDLLLDNWYWLDKTRNNIQFTPNSLKELLSQTGFFTEKLYTTSGDFGIEEPIRIIKKFFKRLTDNKYLDILNSVNNAGNGEELRAVGRKRGSTKSGFRSKLSYSGSLDPNRYSADNADLNNSSLTANYDEIKSLKDSDLRPGNTKGETICTDNEKLYDLTLFPESIRPYIQRVDGKYVHLSEDFYRPGIKLESEEDLKPLAEYYYFTFSGLNPFYAHFGGIGDAMMLLSSIPDNEKDITIFSIPTSVPASKAFYDRFPDIKNVYFIEKPKSTIHHIILMRVLYSINFCKGTGITPGGSYDAEWNENLDIFNKYKVKKHPKWVESFRGSEKLQPFQVVIAPKGSVKGTLRSKRNIINPRYWKHLLRLLKDNNIKPVLIGTPDESSAFPADDNCIDKRSYSIEEQMRIIASADVLIAADSWHKTFAAFAGVQSLVFRSVTGFDLVGVKDTSEYVFIDPWETIKPVNNFSDFIYAFNGIYNSSTGKSLTVSNELKVKERRQPDISERINLSSLSRPFWERDYSSARSVLIRCTPAVGDVLMLTALINELKSQFAHLEITVSCEDYLKPLFTGNGQVANVITYNSPGELREEAESDIVLEYSFIIDLFKEYKNKLHFMDILGNIAGIKFTNRDIVYNVLPDEKTWAEAGIRELNPSGPVIGVHFSTNKDLKRSYPFGYELTRELRKKFPNACFVNLGSDAIASADYIYDCAGQKVPLRKQIALASLCDAFITIDSAFFHVGHNLFDKPTLLIAGPTNPNLIGNQAKGFAYVRNENLDCLSCYWQNKSCNIECMKALRPGTIAEAFISYLNGNYEYISCEEREMIEVEIPSGMNYEAFLWNYFSESKTDIKLVITDNNKILPDYCKNWNGIEVLRGDFANEKPSVPKKEPVFNSGNGSSVNKPVHSGFDFSNPGSATVRPPVVAKKEITDTQDKPLNIVWEGSQFVWHSLALINREHCSNIIDADVASLTIVPYEPEQFSPEGNVKYEKLLSHDIRVKDLAVNKKIPYVWIRHQWPPKFDPPRGAKWIIMQPWEYSMTRKDFAELFNSADEVWTPSNFSRQCFINSGVDFNKVQVVPNGIDPELFCPFGDMYPINSNKKLRFLFVGGTIFRKGIDILLQSYAETFTSEDDVCLVIKDMGGETFYRGQTARDLIRSIQERPNSPEIIYMDESLTEDEMASLYRSCDVFVSPYRGEGFSLPALEAMACGLPVVVTKGGATDDFVDESTGWLVSAGKRSIGDVIDKYPLAGEAFVLEPDNGNLSAILKDIYARPSVIMEKGLRAALSARTQWTWKKATLKLFSRLDALYGTRMAATAANRLSDGDDDAAILLGRAEIAYFESDYQSASLYYNQALETEDLPERYIIHVLHRLAQIQIASGQSDEAMGQLVEAENVLGAHPDTSYLKACAHRSRSEWTEALECLTSVYESWQDSRFDSTLGFGLDDLLCETADAMMGFDDHQSAMALYSEALKSNNNSARACLGAAKCFVSAGAVDEARNMLDWAVSLDPDMMEAIELIESLES